MRCPNCGQSEDRVLDTREQKDGEAIRRRRECLNCKARFTTLETTTLSYPWVIKKDGRREPFSREKILKGIQAACQKRPIGQSQIEGMVDRISQWVLTSSENEISAQEIGLRIMHELRPLDGVAYVRFASVYRTFTDIQEFVNTLDPERITDEVPRTKTRPPDALPT